MMLTSGTTISTTTLTGGVSTSINPQYVVIQKPQNKRKPKPFILIDDTNIVDCILNDGKEQIRFYKDDKEYWYKLEIVSAKINSHILLSGSYDRRSWINLKHGHPVRDFNIDISTGLYSKKSFKEIITNYESFLKKLISDT